MRIFAFFHRITNSVLVIQQDNALFWDTFQPFVAYPFRPDPCSKTIQPASYTACSV